MSRRSPLLIIVAVLWASAALGLSYLLTRWPWWVSAAEGLEKRPEPKRALPSTGPTPTPHAADGGGVQAETWRTVGKGWAQGDTLGTLLLPEGAGLGLSPDIAQGNYTSSPWEVSLPVNALSWEWQGVYPQGSDVAVQARLRFDEGDWSSWWDIPLSHEEQDPQGPWVSELVGVPLWWAGEVGTEGAGDVQYRLQLRRSRSGASPAVESLTLSVINSLRGPHIKTAKAMLVPYDGGSGVPRPPIISRAGWGADESLTDWEPEYRTPRKVIIHHTVTYGSDPLAMLRAIHYYHAVTRRWGDIGYNYLIDDQGNIYEGRRGGEGVVGGHARPYNYGSIGIALLGDFTERDLSPAAEQALVEMLTWIAGRYGIASQGRDPAWGLELPNVLGHRDVGSTTCPGERAYRRLPYLRAVAAERLLAYPPVVEIQTPRSGGVVGTTTRVQASSSSPLLSRLELHIDDQLVSAGEGSPLVWEWDTTSYRDGEHMLKAVAQGHNELSGESTHTVVVDNSPPRGSVVINSGAAYTGDPLVTLALVAVDAGAGVRDMELAEDGQWQAKETYHSRHDWRLSEGEGIKTVAVRFWDGAGNLSPVYTDTITVDTSPPLWDPSCTVNSSAIQVGVRDEHSGLVISSAEYGLSADGGNGWGPWRLSASSGTDGTSKTHTVVVPLAAITDTTIRFRMVDRVGNWSISPHYGLYPEAEAGGAIWLRLAQMRCWLGMER